MEDELIVPSEILVATTTAHEDMKVPAIISLEGPDVEPQSGSFAVLSQYLIDKMDTLERQFQKWYTSLILGLGRHLDQVNSSIEAIYQMGLTKRETKRDEYHTQKLKSQSNRSSESPHLTEKTAQRSEMNPWTAWISQIRLNEQEVPEFFRTSDAMKQNVEIVEDEEMLQTTTCTPKDIDKDPKGWKVAFQDELDSFERLDVMDPVPLSTLDTSTLDILPCKVVMVKKPQGDGTHRKKGRVVVCGNFQQVQPGEETCANTPSFPMLRTLISLAALYKWAVESWEGMQVSSQQNLCDVDPSDSPFLCRLRMDCSNQGQDSIFLQEYRRIVTVIRQEDIVADVHDKRSPMPFMCGSSHMPRKEEGSAHKRTKPQTPTPKGDVSLADERVKADRETQRRERGQAKQRALQHASVPAKASMRDPGTESESAVVRKKPARTEDETPSVSESSALPATPAESEISQPATTTIPQQAMPSEDLSSTQPDSQQVTTADESQPLAANPQPVDRRVEETTPTQSRESSIVKKRVVKKGSAAIAEQGAITELRSRDTSASSAGDPRSVPKVASTPRPPSSPKAASAPKSVPSPKAMSPKATEPKGVVPVAASPIRSSPKAAAPKVASPKTPIVKSTPLPKTTSVPKALSPPGAQTPPKALVVPKETVPKKRTQWSEIEDDTEEPSESAPKANPRSEEPPKTKAKSEVSSKAKAKSDGPPKAKAKSEGPSKAKAKTEGPPKTKPKSESEVPPKTMVNPTPAPSTRHPAAATVAVKSSSSSAGKFLVQNIGESEWPVDEPKAKLPVWKKKDSFLSTFLNHKVIIANCPTGSGKSTILPALAAMHLHPQAGRVCCTQIRRVTTQSVSRNTKDIWVWDIARKSLVVGYTHGTEKLEHWDKQQTKVLFLTEGIDMRQVMSHHLS